MRTALSVAVSMIAIGAYLALAGTIGLAPGAIAIGIAAIALLGAVAAMAGGQSAGEAEPGT